MLTTPTRNVPAQELRPGDAIRVDEVAHVDIDEVRNTAEGVTVYGRVPGTERKSRRTFDFKYDQTVSVLPTDEQRDEIAAVIAGTINSAPLDPDLGGALRRVAVSYDGSVRIVTGGPEFVWTCYLAGNLPLPPDEVDDGHGNPVDPGEIRPSEAAMAAADAIDAEDDEPI